jgi:2-octaprenylphenol hydroxylase
MKPDESLMQTQVAVVGAGLVGMAATVAMHQAGYQVVLVDAKQPDQTPKVTKDAWDQKIYAISPNNVQWLGRLGVWQHIAPSRIGSMQAMQIWGDATGSPLVLNAEDAYQDHLAYIVEGGALNGALMQQITACNIPTLFGSVGEQLVSQHDKTLLHLQEKTLECELLLAADGSHSWVRRQINAPLNKKNYDQVAIVANFETEAPHDNIARQWFSHDSEGNYSILAWLPLPGNKISIVWSVAVQFGQALMKLEEHAFTQQVSHAGDHLLGKLTQITAPASFPLALQTSEVLTQDAVVFIGDAAHQIHPLAGQGMNLGFRDVIDLLAILQDKTPYQSIHDPGLLKRYSRVRKADVFDMRLLTDGLFQLFESNRTTIKALRNFGLSLTDHSTIKKLLVEKAISL